MLQFLISVSSNIKLLVGLLVYLARDFHYPKRQSPKHADSVLGPSRRGSVVTSEEDWKIQKPEQVVLLLKWLHAFSMLTSCISSTK